MSAAALNVEPHIMTARGRGVLPSLRSPAPRLGRRVFWAVEQGQDIAVDNPPPRPASHAGTIEITLADGTLVRVDNQVDATALRRVLDALQGR